jgi:hypothetical protein
MDLRKLITIVDLNSRSRISEDVMTGTGASKSEIEKILRKAGYENFKISGNKLAVLVQIPDGNKKDQFRAKILQDILTFLKKRMPGEGPEYSNDASLSSIGGIVFASNPTKILVKDVGKQGEKSAGVANEIELASILQGVVDKYGSVDVTFTDERGKTLSIENVIKVDLSGKETVGRKKADVVLKSETESLPISIKKLNAETWESADNLFGKRARKILDTLVADGVVTLTKIKERKGQPVYKLSKEIVMEPTESEAISAIFGSDLNPQGGVVIQTFQPEHFKQDKNTVTVDAHVVITSKEDIPESHLMLWILRNDSDRNSASLGIPGIRPLGVTLTRALGAKKTKDVIMVDVDGNVIEKPSGEEKPQPEPLTKPKRVKIQPAAAKAKIKKVTGKTAGVGRALRK